MLKLSSTSAIQYQKWSNHSCLIRDSNLSTDVTPELAKKDKTKTAIIAPAG